MVVNDYMLDMKIAYETVGKIAYKFNEDDISDLYENGMINLEEKEYLFMYNIALMAAYSK